MTCPLGDVDGVRRASARPSARASPSWPSQGSAQRRAQAASSLEQLKVGDVIAVPQGRRSGLAVVIDPGLGQHGQAHPLVVTIDRWAGRLSDADFSAPGRAAGQDPGARRASTTAARRPARTWRRRCAPSACSRHGPDGPEPQLPTTRSSAGCGPQLRQHPVHGCDEREQHLRWAERWTRLRHDTDKLERRVEGKTHSIARVFDQVCLVLEELGYLDGEEVTDAGRQLARVYNESDLLVVECLRAGPLGRPVRRGARRRRVDGGLREPAARGRGTGRPRWRGQGDAGRDGTALWASSATWRRSTAWRSCASPTPGFAWAAWRWAAGAELEQVLQDDPDLTAGRLRALVQAAGRRARPHRHRSPTSRCARRRRASLAAVRRGVVTYSSVS